ncbi:probable cytochrome P450 9f2 [Anopheles aquasalis]|uniref:probable cytochrome P450 9f2 n=1 Tax=Anopheles aquasalis TaxID=42839 RepID=UPI00215B33A0|nr:probable cytochrome P450 9f2 [Anopheles aquasalis]
MELNVLYVIPLLSVLLALWVYLTRNNGYFKDLPIPCLPSVPLFGSSARLMLKRISFQDFVRESYNRFPDARIYGMFEMLTPMFVVRDPELIKRITVKDFDHFVNHRSIFGTADDPTSSVMLSKTLFVLKDQRWRDMRTTLSPTFTGSKMRQMFELIVECSTSMVQHYREQARDGGPRVYEVKDVFVRFTNDVIATCAFGVKIDSFRDDQNEFFRYGKEITNFARPHVFLKMMGYLVFPWLMDRLQIDLFDRKHSEFFTEVFRQSVAAREKHGIVRPDMVHLLMQARNGTLRYQAPEREEHEGFATAQESSAIRSEGKVVLTEPDMVAQCLIFFVAGFDTIATCMTFLMYELAIAPDLQDRLYEEVQDTEGALSGGALTYDALQRMRYLDMVVTETLRKWLPQPATDRLCTKEYVVPAEGDHPAITIPKGANVSIPTAGLHYDPRYYPEPDRYDPERFNEENRQKLHPAVYLPFGIGPRNCIGSRFALMEVKAIVYHLLQAFRFERTEKTPVPMRLNKGFSTLQAADGVHLKLVPRDL